MASRGAGRHRRDRRRWLPRTLLLVLAVAGWVLARPAPVAEPVGSGHRREPLPVATAATWVDVVGALDRLRAVAYTSGSVSALDEVYAPRSAAGRRDRRALHRLVSAGLRVDRLDLRVLDADPVRLDRSRVVLRVVDELGPYRLLDVRGAPVATRPGRRAATWSVTLTRSGAGWRVMTVARPAGVSDPRGSARRRALGEGPARTRGR